MKHILFVETALTLVLVGLGMQYGAWALRTYPDRRDAVESLILVGMLVAILVLASLARRLITTFRSA